MFVVPALGEILYVVFNATASTETKAVVAPHDGVAAEIVKAVGTVGAEATLTVFVEPVVQVPVNVELAVIV